MKDIIAHWRQGNWGGGRDETESEDWKTQSHSTGCCFLRGRLRSAKFYIGDGEPCGDTGPGVRNKQ